MGAILNSRRVTPVTGVVAFGAVTGSNVTVLDLTTLNKLPAGLLITSTLAGATSDVIVAIGGVDVANIGPAAAPIFMPFANFGSMPPGVVAVRHGGVAPTAGNLRVTAFPVR